MCVCMCVCMRLSVCLCLQIKGSFSSYQRNKQNFTLVKKIVRKCRFLLKSTFALSWIFRTRWSRRKKEWKEQRTLGGKGRKEREKESCTVGPGEWALSEVVHEWYNCYTHLQLTYAITPLLSPPHYLCISHRLSEPSLTNSTDEQSVLEWMN